MNARTIKFSIFYFLFSTFFATSALIFSGCAKEQQTEVAIKPLRVTESNKLAVMQTAEDVLVGMHFAIEKADPNSGQIRTRPLSGAQFFEVWRDDNVGSFNKAEANLHSIRRTVELRIYPQGENTYINCTAKVARLSLPESEVSSSARAYQMFSRSTSSLQKIRLNPQQQADMAWIDLGEDKPLAAEILKRIEQQLSPQNSSPK